MPGDFLSARGLTTKSDGWICRCNSRGALDTIRVELDFSHWLFRRQ
jgi:hypothetical protein